MRFDVRALFFKWLHAKKREYIYIFFLYMYALTISTCNRIVHRSCRSDISINFLGGVGVEHLTAPSSAFCLFYIIIYRPYVATLANRLFETAYIIHFFCSFHSYVCNMIACNDEVCICRRAGAICCLARDSQLPFFLFLSVPRSVAARIDT